jgi:hypothetical protein
MHMLHCKLILFSVRPHTMVAAAQPASGVARAAVRSYQRDDLSLLLLGGSRTAARCACSWREGRGRRQRTAAAAVFPEQARS